METAKIFETGRSQAVRLPKKFRFNADEVVIQQLGDAVLLVPKESLWQTFLDGLNGFTESRRWWDCSSLRNMEWTREGGSKEHMLE